MIINRCFNFRSFTLATVLIASFGHVNNATAYEQHFFVELNNRTATRLINTLGISFTPLDINDTGQVVGSFSTAEGFHHAFITGPGGIGMRDLGTLGGNYSAARAINNTGQVVGYSSTAEGNSHAFITGPNGMGMRDLGSLGGISSATGINNVGQVAGYSVTDAGSTRAFITGPDGMGMRDLGTSGGYWSSADGINDAGQVVGSFYTAAGRHAFLTGPDGIGMRDIGSNHIKPISDDFDINNVGQVVGRGITSQGFRHAFITGADGMRIKELESFDRSSATSYSSKYYSMSGVHGINDAGQAVGWSSAGGSFGRAFITGPDEGLIDLNSLVDLPDGVTLTDAMAINNNGQIIAVSSIPEPETYALMLAGLGLIGLMGGARRRKISLGINSCR